ncbi:hypothetical protein LA080_004201 [Diaporthe eres]|nr:hypothetical protein LA080_004201 [Diaporthe eres]
MRPTLADAPGCYPNGEKFSDIVKEGDIHDIIDSFCTGGPTSYNYGGHFGNYPNVNASQNITFSEDTCKKVLTYVKDKCNNWGGELHIMYINGSFSEDPGPLRRFNSRDQSVNSDDGNSSDDNTVGYYGYNEYNEDDIAGSGASVTSTATVASTSTMTTTIIQAPPAIITSFVTSTVSAQQQQTNETSTSTSTSTVSCHSILVALAGLVGQKVNCGVNSTISTTSSTSTSSTSSAINTNDFYGIVKVDPQRNNCPDK